MFQHKIITHKFQTFWNHRIKLFHSHSTGRVLKGSFTSLLIVSKRLAQIQQLALQQFARMAQTVLPIQRQKYPWISGRPLPASITLCSGLITRNGNKLIPRPAATAAQTLARLALE